MIPVTILTGFLGAGKTTILNQIIAKHPEKKFGLIINEFGEEGIDGQLVQSSGEEMVEMSNGCICCVVRKDLQDAAQKLVESGKVDYIIIETSGLAEPIPVAQTFSMETLGGKVMMDAIVCIVDCENYKLGTQEYSVGIEQIQAADIIVINKINPQTEANLPEVRKLIQNYNSFAAVIENRGDLNVSLLIQSDKWTVEKMTQAAEEGKEDDEHEHHHEHDDVDEYIFVTEQPINAPKLSAFLEQLPQNVVRCKGFLKLEIFPGQFGTFLCQIVGATRMLVPFVPQDPKFNAEKSRLVFIGKNLDRAAIREGLEKTIVN
jgi:G3E family GTPase